MTERLSIRSVSFVAPRVSADSSAQFDEIPVIRSRAERLLYMLDLIRRGFPWAVVACYSELSRPTAIRRAARYYRFLHPECLSEETWKAKNRKERDWQDWNRDSDHASRLRQELTGGKYA